ncbi:MAG: DUF302 domain-containing protein [Thermoanaerobaculia bacterium]
MKELGIRRTVDLGWDEAVEKVRATLANEGFGVLSEIPIHEKLKEKLGVEFRRYLILGACNPPLAHKALQSNPEIGLLLPCNVVVYENEGKTVVSAIDPDMMVAVAGDNPVMKEVAADARARLERAIAAV